MTLQRFGRSPRPFVGSQRRKTSWTGGPITAVGGETISASGVTLLGTALQSAADGLTIVRMRGEVLFYLSSANADVNGFDHCAFGVCIVSDNAAFVGGAASIPSPITDLTWDGWMYHRMFSLVSPIIGTDVRESMAADTPTSLRLVVDSKAMRKFKNTDVLVAVVEVTEIGTSFMKVHGAIRTLVKLP